MESLYDVIRKWTVERKKPMLQGDYNSLIRKLQKYIILKRRNKMNDFILRVDCDCGKELLVIGDGWKIEVNGPINFVCPCGKSHDIKIAPCETKDAASA